VVADEPACAGVSDAFWGAVDSAPVGVEAGVDSSAVRLVRRVADLGGMAVSDSGEALVRVSPVERSLDEVLAAAVSVAH
jgi:hypothetical protein